MGNVSKLVMNINLYNATGQKVKKTVTYTSIDIDGQTQTITDYLDGYQYTDGKLNFFPHTEGYVKAVGDQNEYRFFYVYNYLDHLGNVRVSYGKDPETNLIKILEQNHYYPFGLKHTNYNTDKRRFTKEEWIQQLSLYRIKPMPVGENVPYNYKYNGKEFQDELGLNIYDYGARNYDPAIARFWQIDPKAEKYLDISSYVYVADNPILYIDPDGKEIIVANKNDQKAILKSINSRALGTFAFNKSGSLYLKSSKGDEAKYSKYYQGKLVEAIKSDKKIEIAVATEAPYYKVGDDGKTLVERKDGRVANVDESGGGITTPRANTDQKVFVSGNVPEEVKNNLKDTEGNPLKVEPADILMHELVGHAIPHIVGSDTGNAVENENKVHRDCHVPEREPEPNHLETKKLLK